MVCILFSFVSNDQNNELESDKRQDKLVCQFPVVDYNTTTPIFSQMVGQLSVHWVA